MGRNIITFILVTALLSSVCAAEESERGVRMSITKIASEQQTSGGAAQFEASAHCYGGYCGPVKLKLLYCPAMDCYEYRELPFGGGDIYFNDSAPYAEYWDVRDGDVVKTFFSVGVNNSGIYRFVAAGRVGESAWTYSEPTTLKAGGFFSSSQGLAIEYSDTTIPYMGSGPRLVAVTGGPYSREVGREVVFDASNSSNPEIIVSYHWDFGDGEQADGKVVRHVYTSPKFYTVTLTVRDSSGNSASSSNGVYIYPVDLMVTVTISPKQDKYEYGDLVRDITVTVSRMDGTVVEGATLSGVLSGRQNKADLTFQELGHGKYRAAVSYPILKGEADYIDLFVKATDSYGNTGIAVDKLVLASRNTSIEILMQEPSGTVYARGQKVLFEARVVDVDGRGLQDVNVTLYEGWTDRKIPMTRKGDVFSVTYEIPKVEKKRLSFLVRAVANAEGRQSTAVTNVDIDISSKLNVAYIDPKAGQILSEARLLRLNITYPNGEIITDDQVNVLLNDKFMVLERDGDTFISPLSLGSDERTLTAYVRDSSGNVGEASLFLSPDPEAFLMILKIEYIVAAALVLILAGCTALYYKKNREREDLRRQYEEIKERRHALRKLMKNIMHEYYTRKISSEDARKRMLDYEKEMLLEQERMKAVLQKLGIKKMEAEGKEELIEWIFEKLQDGEDPELLKEGLSDAGIDPRLVDNIRRHLI